MNREEDLYFICKQLIPEKSKSCFLLLMFYSLGERRLRDFPEEYIELFTKTIENQKFFHVAYDNTIPISEQFTPKELKEGFVNLQKERSTLILETRKHLPSCEVVFGTSEFVWLIAREYDRLINLVSEYLRIMKVENPEVIFPEENLSTPIQINNGFRTLGLSSFRIEQLPEPEIEDFPEDIDRFTGDKNLTHDIISFYKLKNKYHVAHDEVVLSHFQKLSPSTELKYYLGKICDSNLILDQNNFRDLYNVVYGDEFTIDKFWENYTLIKNIVFSKDITGFSPRLIKFLVTLETDV